MNILESIYVTAVLIIVAVVAIVWVCWEQVKDLKEPD